ncbi:pyruvate dehydrogenase (acetyl-transferring) E1 component, alpha subunit [Candidatus Phytoplasma oryzae]|uniref:Pyruvate dehydrogenase E1 component subunit alpha n=1 Tax=Candidatus Phytoplasma oryzae TaxID=203274 RepID=A0A139JQX3_9MOLU|nr:pyruvate dehydrogenase (acetyl-transferring) E1 component subunit alpha [Candidatus Phytoplasma oryzae]KXT29373.1 pyruvate dehydrogenase (acetyl-transferring) E1 component, alpha subunit [Candidatus Phytoplasma oryzae]RAM57958.1 pyruvate dehydrogenase [Candidatus Phytoplasma oryzae]
MKIIDSFNSFNKKMFQILDLEGKVINSDFEPKINKQDLLKMYKIMILTRIADVSAVRYQRQGRMLSFVMNQGHEASQIGTASALKENDWISPYFRDLGIYLYRDIPLHKPYLYWYGNEIGSDIPASKHILPVNIIIGSSINIGAGLAFASKFQNKKEVVVATIGDGGTAHEEFYAGLNYASVLQVPLVVVIQNNQYAISTPRKIASKTETLAEKSYAFGIPGLQVDGNDVLAVHAAVKEIVERARQGNSPGLIELVTYRMGAHTTNDNPNLYRDKKEEEEWRKKDPILRFQKYLLNKNILTSELINQIEEETKKYVEKVQNEIEQYGNKVKPIDIFKHIYDTMTSQLLEQYNEYTNFLKNKK